MILDIILALTVSFGAVRAQMRCDTKADVTFMLDSSSNIGPQNFVKELNFIRDVSNNMQVAPDKVQVSALTFGTGVNNQFYLNQYTDNVALQQAINNIQYKGGLPKIPNAIRFATGTSFSPIHGGRGDAPHVAVLLTNQPSGTIDQVKLESQIARDNGLILYTVGIGSAVDQAELQEIASQPDGRHMFQAQNFDALGSLSDLLATKICNELPPDPTMLPAPTGCLQKADVVFMVDSSSSVGSTNFQKMEHFLKDVVTKIDVAPNKVQVGLVQYSNYPSVEIPLGQYHTRPETLKAIEGLTYMGGGTNDADAMKYTSQQVFSQYSGARGDVPRIAVLITDGGSANPTAAVAAANKARQESIGVIAVGVGNRINHAELSNIANDPSSQNTFTVGSYNDLDSISDKLIAQMCQIKSTQPSITGPTLPTDPCHDKLTNCDQYGADVCTNYPQWATENCGKSCGFCSVLYTKAPPKCQDTLPDCTNYGRDFCSQPGSFVAQNCELFCGFCGVNTSTTGYYGKCSYKGKQYQTGEKWYDGCDYECICENGNTGRYKCNNRCPVFYNLPRDCTLVAQTGDCCLKPVCNFNPTVNVQQSSGHGVTANGVDVCVYKGKQYYQRQSWRDGCNYQCTCTDAKSGLYRCEDLCPSYGSIPPYCHLEQAAGECCQKPMCEFDSQTGSFQGNGQISGNGVGAVPTEHPPCLDAISTCNMYSSDVCVSYRGWAAINCRKYCNMCPDGLPQPGPNDRCVYNGKLYKQGETWNTACDTQCTCENAIYGYYRCVNTCPSYNNLPKFCKLEKKAGQCCHTVQCVNGYFLTSSLTPNTIGSGGAINVTNPAPGITYIAPTSSTGGVLQPGTGGTGYIPPKINGCLYKGHIYVQDQAWEDGCEYSCVCKEALTGLYSCMQKCPTYPALAPTCHMVVDRNDECCKSPVCTLDPVTNIVPVPIPVFMPAVQTHSIVEPPNSGNFHPFTSSVTLSPTGFTPAPPTLPSSQIGTGGIGYCLYRGNQYKQGQVWEDGCDFTCICQDASRGHYQCTEKCVHYGVLPEQCYLIKDPTNPCCDLPKCNFQVNFVTHIGDLGQGTTSRPLGEYCVYEGQQYQQGQTWYDGCSFRCTCEDAAENTYRCLTRCPEYENVNENCQFLPDPKDPSCCVMPKCPETSTPGATELPSPAPTGSYIGQGPGTGFCEYKGIKYTQGQAWQDGCDLNCVCADAQTGLYKCTEVCERYNSLPEYCTLITDFTNPCCKKPRCAFPAVTSAVTGEPSTIAPTPPRPGETPQPNPQSTLAPHYKYCIYKNVQYTQGETWEDGCQYRCRCDDADKGLYVCNERCASYEAPAENCRMVSDPRDSCCLVPSCLPPPQQSTPVPVPGVSTPAPTPFQIPTVKPGVVTGSAKIPTPQPGMTPPPINYCEYKGTQYSQGQKWDDGCQFTCECVDATTGNYKCVEKCQRYVELPSNCRLAKDPANPCCQVPECTEPTPAPQNTPQPNPNTTPKPAPQNVCVYKGNMYTQGQQWYDGCEYVCNCEDSMQGLYTCNERCPLYGDLPAECALVPSSSDPLCCKQPKCQFLNTKNVTSGYLTPPTPPPGVIYGGAATPTPLPTMAPSPGYSPTPGPSTTPAPKVCIYKGNQYVKGQKWQDGCDYTCECLDDMTGQYKCTEICSKMDDLPAGCRLITDSYNPCCKKAYCPATLVPTPAPPGVSTPAPTPQPKTGCMYNGVMFSQGEHWNDGCDLQCVCEDGMTGYYRCNDRCNKYDVPEGCELVTDPRDSCCKVPYCPPPTTPKPWFPGMEPTPAPGLTFAPNMIPTPAPGVTYAPGMFPTWVPGMVPTPAPGYTFAPGKIPTPAPGSTYAPLQFPTWVPGMVPTPAPGFTYAPGKIPTPAPGRTYAPGMYPTYVPGMVPTPAPGFTYAPNKIPTPAPYSTYAPGMFPTWVPGMAPTPAPGLTYAPWKIPTPAPGRTYAPGMFPTYVPGMVPTPAPGATYAPWLIPTPAPGRTYAPGMYPTYVPGMVPTPAPGYTYAPEKIPTPAPGMTYAPGKFPTWVPGMVPTPAPGYTFAPNMIPTPAPGRTYAPGKFPTWVPGMVPTPAPGYTYPTYLVPTPAPGQTYAPGKFPVPVTTPYPTPAPGSTYPPYVPGMVPTPAPGQTYAPNLIPTPAPGITYAPGMFPTYVPGMVPTPAPGKTFAPWLIPGITPAVGSTYAPFKYPTWVPGMVPTPAPGVTYAPNMIPTPAPGSTYLPGLFPTWVPGMVPTPAPGRTFAPNLVPTPAPGVTYAPGKFPTWVPGMVPTPAPGVTYAPNMIPTPAPGSTYAPLKFPTYIPGMVPTPAPGVTYAPNMIPTPAPGRTYAPGMFPTYVPGMVPTPAPGYTYAPNMIPTPAPGQTYAPGKFPTYIPGMAPTPAPGYTFAPWKVPTPAPGVTYAPGKYPTWVPGMVPTPAPGVTYAPNLIPTPAPGRTYAPGKFPTWVPGMVPTPAPGQTYAPNLFPTPAPGSTYKPGMFPTWVPGMVPTPAPGVTYAPNMVPTPAPGSTYAPLKYPTWVPGMVPTPAPGVTYAPNILPTPAPGYTYAPGKYPTWVPGMVPTPAPDVTYAPNMIPTPAPGSTYAPGKFPTWVPGMVPTPAPGYTYPTYLVPTPAPGQTYAPGKFPVPVTTPYPTPAPGSTYPPYVPGMVPTPAPGQTYAPNLIPTPAPGITYAPGMFPTYVPGMVPTPAPGKTFAPWLIPGITPAVGSTYAPFKYPTWVPGMVPTPAPGVTYAPNMIPTPAPGRTYAPGLFPTWVPGMVPTPAPGRTFAPNMVPTPATGVTYAPGKFPTWVPGMVPTPAPGVTYAPNMIPTPAPGSTYAPLKFPTYIPGMVPTPAPGFTYAPNMIPTPAPGRTYAPGMFPTYVPGMVPTPAPGVTYAPNMIPTPAPGVTYAPGKFPTWVPGMVPTPAPGVTYAPNMIPTPAPGFTYAPGKFPTWVPGMVPTPAPGYTYPTYLVPTPAPGQTYAPGKFPVPVTTPYPTPAPGSTYPPYVPGMVPTPAPGQTYAPNLIPTPAPGITYAPGMFPTYVPGMVPTPAPGKTFAPWLIPGITPAVGSTYAPFKYPTWVPGMVPTPAPGVTYAPNMIPTPAPGRTYAPGMFPTWVPGMVPTPAPGRTFAPNMVPTPAPGVTYAPGKFPTWVPGMVPTPAPGRTFAPNMIPTPAPGYTYAPGKFPTYVPGMVPTPAPGYTYAPNMIPTPAPGYTYAPGKFPTYVPGMVPTPAPGYTYAPNMIPTPSYGMTYAPGKFPTYLPGMVPTPAPGYTYAPWRIPTPAPGMTYAPGKFPTWVPGMVPTPAPGLTYAPNMIPTPAPGATYAPGRFPTPAPSTVNPFPVPTAIPGSFQGSGVNGNRSGCVHYGVVYNAGQTWQDGCKYDCECLDDHTGRYECKERCPLFLNIPSYCRLVIDPSDPCCKIPECATQAPVPKVTQPPQPVVTPSPGPTPAPSPGFVPTPQPTTPPTPAPTPEPKEGCVMNGVHYVAGQSWYEGCDRRCVCEDGKTHFYRCFDRCAKYPTVPTGCTMVPDPKDPTCCEVPQCIPLPGPGQTLPTAIVSITGVPGVISGVGTPPTLVPGVGGFTAAPKNVCVYNGRMYTQGQKWQDGCQYDCVCTDGMTGKYECTERCAAFPLVPPACQMKRSQTDVCCFVPVCDFNQTAPTLPPPVSPGVSTQLPPLPPSYCVYKGVPYSQGQTWDDGCTKKCRCDDADNNIYTCYDRCKSYNNLGSGCVMIADPMDPCCQIPKCTYVPTPGPTQPGSTINPPTVCPFPMPTSVPGVVNGLPQPDPVTGQQPSNVGYCEYKGTQYTQGQSWDDGCSYTCACIDSSSGQYQCTEKCPRYVGIPSYCKMAQDPSNKCCTKPACNVCPTTPVPPTGLIPVSAGPTPAPQPKEVCIMNGKEYTQGQKWYVGCEKICVCDDGKTGAYSCNQRCPDYPQQQGCKMVPDQRDPKCCLVPSCPTNAGVFGQVNGSGTPAPPVTLQPPQYGSTMVAPSPLPQVCVYKGKSYSQGQRWQDGCQYECVCDNAMTGHYLCTDRCPRYPNLSPTCHLVYNPTDPCCQKPECPNATPTPGPDGSTIAPQPTQPQEYCIYQGVPLKQGQIFRQGCEKVCKCEDAMTGQITCDDRCPVYPALTPNCTLTTDPKDQCCQIPSCTDKNGVVIGVPGTISGSNIPTNNPYYPTGTRSGCAYNGQVYQQGQTWDDGCTYHCECLDASAGRYKCTEKCPRSPPLPSYCTLTTDPNNKCCHTPFCQPPTVPPTLPPGSTLVPNPMSTPAPTPNLCVYKGNSYQQGQQWYDGCDYICRCEDSSKNFYNCKQRCAKYDNIQPGCTLVPDPADPTCCERPSCPLLPPTGPNPTVGIITAAPYPGGVITGVNPTAPPGSTLPPPYRSGCVYKGQLFHQGQKWDDGCDYECECLDDMTGQYKCVEKCQKYSSLPSECVLIQDQNKPCCQVPYCDFTNPTPFPGGVPTPGPVQPTPPTGVATVAPYIVPGLPSTPRPGVNTEAPTFTIAPTPKPEGYCVYKGVYYTQGQTWNDGCDKTCRCEDVMKGYYTCNQRCASYPVSSCPLKADPSDSCCLIPDCNTGSIPTPIPTPGPGQTTLSPYTPKPISGSFTGTSGGNPVMVPFQTGPGSTGTAAACVYKGMIYQQGQTWDDGCNYKCECVDASRGQYRCNDRCPKYPYLPQNCYYKQSTTDACCKEPECSHYNLPTTTPSTITVQPGFNTGPSGSNPTIKPANVCLFTDGTQYAQGAKWKVGCNQECTCTDSVTNVFSCTELCPVYSGLPSFCILVQDPKNSCCKMPQCTLPTGITLSPLTGNQTPAPNSLTVLPIGTHQVFSGYNKPQPGQFFNGSREMCIYKGTIHGEGSSWDDACQFTCTCENGKTGMYTCADKCPTYPTLPTYCQSVKVPGQCCPTVSCDIPGYGKYTPVPQLVPTPRPNYQPGQTTPSSQIIVAPNPASVGSGHYPGGGYFLPNASNPNVMGSIRDKCVYKNRLYNQGETWEDGCDYKCECQDSRSGYYVCNPLCPVYNNLPSNQCYLVKADGQCCSQPMCYDPNKQQVVNPLTSSSVFPVVGTYGGGFTGFRPNPIINQGARNSCIYKGLIYHQNAKWDDGCDFACTCIDETTGQYSCTSKCPTYTNIPPICRLVDQAGSCCKRIECPTTSVTLPPGPTQAPPSTPPPTFDPLCHDNIENCKDYGTDACGKTYEAWAKRNCNYTCGFCHTPLTTPPVKCEDKLSDCKDYGVQACSGIYEPWAQDNCRSFCGLCVTTAPPGTQKVTTAAQCVDVLTTCSLLDPEFYCKGDYYSWAMDNCRKTCNLCPGGAGVITTPIPQTITTAPKWTLLMKGVAGAPGPDLYQLWHSGQTLNQNIPQAQTLTSSYNGHYKPDNSNHWTDYCFDQIKVGIYNQGVEKAFIVFNATGADKNSWFTTDRIISSSWTDLKTAQKEIFSMSGDANTGREFYASGHSDPTDTCDSFGWMMISTKPACFYEAGDQKPSFYYAPGTSLAHWGYTNPGTGDVFAIQGHAACTGTGQHTDHPQTTTAAVCDYKGHQYSQGQYWNDGCQYNCTCEDASIGYYRCRNLCPQYTNLPPGCTLQKSPGECCASPDCGSTLVSTIKPVVFVGGAAFCTYRDQFYTQDQTWNDGCSQSCTCTNAQQGMYSCRAVCLNWNTLPSVCHLEDPPPGLCCQQPRCPSGIVITIPKAYKDEYPGYTTV